MVERLLHGTVDEIRAELHHVPELRSAFESYLDRFGDQTVNELKLESLTLHDDPLPLFRSVGALGAQQALHDESAGPSAGERLRASAREQVDRSLARRPVRRLVFGWILRHARSRVRDRENLRFERTRLFGRVRRIFVEIGRRCMPRTCSAIRGTSSFSRSTKFWRSSKAGAARQICAVS